MKTRGLAGILMATAILSCPAWGGLPTGWGGDGSYDAGVWTVFGRGDLNAATVVWREFKGDVSIRARVRTVHGVTGEVLLRPVAGWEAGVFIGNDVSVADDGRHIPGENSIRASLGGWQVLEDMGWIVQGPTYGPDCSWIRIDRRGDDFVRYYSSDGVGWIPFGEVLTSPMHPLAKVGLSATGYLCYGWDLTLLEAYMNLVEFDNVTVEPITGGAGGSDNDWFVSGSDMYSQVPGNVGIGTSEPTEKLDVHGTVRVRGLSAGGGATVVVDNDGKLWKQSSSRRYKTDIRTLETDPVKVLALNPVSFRWNTTGEADIGLIAEDVAQVLGDLALYDAAGRPDGVKYDKLALYLLSVVKAQQQKIAQLEAAQAERESLVRRVEALEQAARLARTGLGEMQ